MRNTHAFLRWNRQMHTSLTPFGTHKIHSISYLQEFPEEFPKFPSGCHDVDISIFHRTTCSMSTTNINDRINFKLFLQNMIHVYIQLLPTYSFSFLSFRHRPGWRDRICTKPSHTTGMLIRAALIMQSKVPPKRR